MLSVSLEEGRGLFLPSVSFWKKKMVPFSLLILHKVARENPLFVPARGHTRTHADGHTPKFVLYTECIRPPNQQVLKTHFHKAEVDPPPPQPTPPKNNNPKNL